MTTSKLSIAALLASIGLSSVSSFALTPVTVHLNCTAAPESGLTGTLTGVFSEEISSDTQYTKFYNVNAGQFSIGLAPAPGVSSSLIGLSVPQLTLSGFSGDIMVTSNGDEAYIDLPLGYALSSGLNVTAASLTVEDQNQPGRAPYARLDLLADDGFGESIPMNCTWDQVGMPLNP